MWFSDDELLQSIRPDYQGVVRPLADQRPGRRMTPLEMVEFNIEHARRFFAGDFDGIMEYSLIDEPVYEFFPSRIRVTGREAVHRYHQLNYDIVIAQVDPERRATAADQSRTHSRTFGENSYATELSGLFKLDDGPPRRCYFNAIIAFQDGKMVGERVWMDEQLSAFFVRELEKDALFFSLPGVERF